MGRTDYIVTAGVGFDLDRSSARNTIGNFETIADTLNTVATKKAAEGFSKNEAVYKKSLDKIAKANKKADDDLVKGAAQSAAAAQAAIKKSMPKPLPAAVAAVRRPLRVLPSGGRCAPRPATLGRWRHAAGARLRYASESL